MIALSNLVRRYNVFKEDSQSVSQIENEENTATCKWAAWLLCNCWTLAPSDDIYLQVSTEYHGMAVCEREMSNCTFDHSKEEMIIHVEKNDLEGKLWNWWRSVEGFWLTSNHISLLHSTLSSVGSGQQPGIRSWSVWHLPSASLWTCRVSVSKGHR